jgi:DNA topoisomerase I
LYSTIFVPSLLWCTYATHTHTHTYIQEESSSDSDDDEIPLNQIKEIAQAAQAHTASRKRARPSDMKETDYRDDANDDSDDDDDDDDDDDFVADQDSDGDYDEDGDYDGNDSDDDSSDDDDDRPLSQLTDTSSKAKAKAKTKAKTKAKAKAKAKPTKKTKAKAKSSKKSSAAEAKLNDPTKYEETKELLPLKPIKEVNKWWDRIDDKKRKSAYRWDTLQHNGVLFPPAYKPHGIKMKYDGEYVDLTPEQEEVATWYAALIESDHAKNKTFNSNFFKDWRQVLGKSHVIKAFSKCDFTPIHAYLEQQKALKKERRKDPEVKKKEKEEKKALEAVYGYALMNGYSEKVGSYLVEPPGLFRGRGKHPKTGRIKKRVYPEQVTINIGKGVPIPKCPMPGHNWKGIIHDRSVTWLAYWKDNINGNFKYVFLAPSAQFKGESDRKKYEKARRLGRMVKRIRKNYTLKLTDKAAYNRQLATATYLIDRLALRVGNEKNTKEEADTVGCCSLRVEHLSFKLPNIVVFDFLGKDSMRYYNAVPVDDVVFRNLRSFCENKPKANDVFSRINTTNLNIYLKELMPGLTAKVFRTYNASYTLQQQLFEAKTPLSPNATVEEKVLFYNNANREVAVLCNHQRTPPKSFGEQMQKMDDKLKELKDKLSLLRAHLGMLTGKPNKKRKVEEEAKTAGIKLSYDAGVVGRQIERLKITIMKHKSRKQLKEDNKDVALNTSKINYMDPRISVAWCKTVELPIERVFPKSVRDKFPWAMEIAPSWRF